ncbi:MAG: hypothetical protein ACI4V7_00585 [Succinivibrionaceae bacterium]
MLYNDYQLQQEIDKKLIINRQKDIISEADELLLSVTQVPFSNKMISILQNRVMCALQQINIMTPGNISIIQRIENLKNQINQSNANSQPTPNFKPPLDITQSMKALRNLRKLRRILRLEFNKGRVSQNDLIQEDKLLEIMVFKVQFASLLRNIDETSKSGQITTARQLISGGLQTLKKLNIDDAWLNSVQEKLAASYEDINEKILALRKSNEANSAESTRKKEVDEDADIIFGTKKKW